MDHYLVTACLGVKTSLLAQTFVQKCVSFERNLKIIAYGYRKTPKRLKKNHIPKKVNISQSRGKSRIDIPQITYQTWSHIISVNTCFIDLQVSASVLWDSSIHDSVFLNRVTQSHERVYLILKVKVFHTLVCSLNVVILL